MREYGLDLCDFVEGESCRRLWALVHNLSPTSAVAHAMQREAAAEKQRGRVMSVADFARSYRQLQKGGV